MAHGSAPPQTGFDPLLCDVALPLSELYFPLGFPVRIDSNSPAVIGAAREIWRHFTKLHDRPALHLRIAVDEASTSPLPPARLPRAQGHLMSAVHSAENFTVADLQQGFAFAWLTPAAVSEAGFLRYHILESLAYSMLVSLYLAPIHAACIALDASGVLLCGDAGAGKTSLAYACARRGWTYVSDDASYLIRGRGPDTVVGRPHFLRFRHSAVTMFPELSAYPPSWRANGKPDIEVPTADLGLTAISVTARPDRLVFLNRRSSGPAGLREYSRAAAAEWLERVLFWGQESVRQAQRESLRGLLRVPMFELAYAACDDAEFCLRSLVAPGN